MSEPFSLIIGFGLAMLLLLRGLKNLHCHAVSTSQFISTSFLFFGKLLTFGDHFVCYRCPFTRNLSFGSFDGVLNREALRGVVKEGRWDDFRVSGLFESALAPVWVSRILLELKQDPVLALKVFKWAESQNGFRHTVENYCVVAHILFCSRMYADAHNVLRQLVVLHRNSEGGGTRVFPCCTVVDVLWLTRNVCVAGYGVFDALFSVLIELGMVEEARECFLRMRNFKVVPKARSCNMLLHKMSKVGGGVLIKKFFGDMVGAGIAPSVYTYNIMIGFLCKEGDLKAARSLFVRMKGTGGEYG